MGIPITAENCVSSTVVLFVRRYFFILFLFQLSLSLQAKQSGKQDSIAYIQLCLIVDVSGSMEGLLYQAQTQIWNVLDEAS